MSTEQHNASSVTPCPGIEAPKASALSPSVVMYWDGGERAITPREKTEIEEHRASCFSIPLVPLPEGWAVIPTQSYDHSVACRAVDLFDQQDAVRIDAEGVNVVPPAAFRADNAHAVGINFVNGEVHGYPDLAEVATVHASDVRLDDDETVTACEAGQPECGPVAHHDSEGVPLCQGCWEELLADSEASEP